jgi:hypothetical protein
MSLLQKTTAAIFPFFVSLLFWPAPVWGQTLGWDPLSLEFGRVAQGQTVYKELTLTTDTNSPPLAVTDIRWTYNQMDAFEWKVEGGLRVITTDSPLVVQLSFTPEDFSFFMAELQITNSSVNAPVLNYFMLGEGAWETTTTTKTTSTTAISTTTTTLAPSDCGDPTGDGEITATDALFTLTAAVGIKACLPAVCDVNDDGKVAASDALTILTFSVGIPVVLVCPP